MKRVVSSVRRRAVALSGPLTALGRATLLVGAVAWCAGALLGWKELMIVAGACLVAIGIALAMTVGRVSIDVHVKLNPTRVVAGDRAVADVIVTNTSNRVLLPVRLEIPVGKSLAQIAVPTLGSGSDFEEVLVIPTARRSVVDVGPARSVRGDPLGLARREHTWTEIHELFIHPAHTPLEGITAGWMRDLEGRPTNDRSPSDVAFHTLREYVPGDDRRHVHWKTSARIGKLMVRQFIDNRRSHLALIVDTNPTHYTDADEFELAVSMTASLGLRAIKDGQETSCVGGAHVISGHTGQALLDGLSRMELGVPASTIPELALRAAPLLTTASVIGIVTGSGAPSHEVQLASRRFSTNTQTLCVQATLGQRSGMREQSGLLVLGADSLESFSRVMQTLARR